MKYACPGALAAALLAFSLLTVPAAAQDFRDRDSEPSAMDARAWRPSGSSRLGVRVRNLDTGVEITQVFPGSPAERAGLQPGDRVVTVGGYQVGYVGDRLYDLSDEVNRRQGPGGVARLVALRRADARLTVVDVPMGYTPPPGPGIPPAPAWGSVTLAGTVNPSPPMRVPPASTLEVRLIQEGINGEPDVGVAEVRQDNFPGFPANFNLTYNRNRVTPGRRCYAEARLIQGAQILSQTNQRFFVLNPQADTRVDLIVTPVPPNPSPSDPAVIISNWYRQYLGREADPAGLNSHLLSLRSGRTLRDVQTTLLASNEFYDRCRNNPATFVSQLYFLVLNRQPTQQDINFWTDRLRKVKNNRAQLVREFLTQAFGNG